ncbi:MAG: hypothetical protein GOV00_04195 [Candidatus Altiarchaeota archaeon]|nr:hypothetical protein [Candidatus Altiarchaeota archaeon]
MEKVLIPKTYVQTIEGPLIFLAGPILGAPNWQDKAIELLFSQQSELTVVSPRRGIRREIAPYILRGDETYFERQREWERHYMDIAAETGAIMFWLPGEKKHDCKKVYGATTRFEIGEWKTRYQLDNNVRLCFGSDGKFPELRVIEYDLQVALPNKTINKTLEETCAEALQLAYQ